MEMLNADMLKLVFTGLSLLISIIAFILSFNAYRYNRSKSHISIAIDLAKEYETILKEFVPMFEMVKRHQEIKDIIDKIDLQKLQRFDRNEIKEVIPLDSDREKINDFFIEFKNFNIEQIRKIYLKDKQIIDESQEISEECLSYYMRIKIITILNNLEQFSMAFVHNIAYDKVVYRSLHQSYFDMIKIFYYKLAYTNISSKDCYYTNIIALFERWKNIDLFLQGNEIENRKPRPVINRFRKIKFKHYK